MTRPWIRFAVCLTFALVLCASCASSQKTEARQPPVVPETEAPPVQREDGLIWVERAFPTGNKDTSVVLVERGAPAEAEVGLRYDLEIKVTNLTNDPLEEVVLLDKAEEGGFRIVESLPKGTQVEGQWRWKLGKLGPRESRTIRVTGDSRNTGTVTHCCDVNWRAPLCATTRIVQPKLSVTMTGASASLLCDPFVYNIKVTNGGTGAAQGVTILQRLPAGVKTVDGEQEVSFEVGTLAPGTSKDFVVRCKASKTGEFQTVAMGRGERLKAESEKVTTVVTRPVLVIEKEGPGQSFVGRTLNYSFTVKNTGDGVAKDAVLQAPIAKGATFSHASKGGVVKDQTVHWHLGDLQPDESRKVTLRINPTGVAELRTVATARAYCAKAVTAAADTKVVGIPAIRLEVFDAKDPIEVGDSVPYIITVTNQGSATGTNIKIICRLEEPMTYLTGSGITLAKKEGRVITFEPLRALAPGQTASWKVNVKAADEGDVRFEVTMTSDQLKRPVTETEATNFYK